MLPSVAIDRDQDLLHDPVVTALLAHVPGVRLRVDDRRGFNAEACGGEEGMPPRITLGADLAHGPDRDRLHAVLAHEVAHHVLQGRAEPRGHDEVLSGAWQAWRRGVLLAVGVLFGRGYWEGALTMLALTGLAWLIRAHRLRRHELAADACSVTLLAAVGCDALPVALAALPFPQPGLVERAMHLLYEHPSVAARRRAIRRAARSHTLC